MSFVNPEYNKLVASEARKIFELNGVMQLDNFIQELDNNCRKAGYILGKARLEYWFLAQCLMSNKDIGDFFIRNQNDDSYAYIIGQSDMDS
jgi:hypothetical protein